MPVSSEKPRFDADNAVYRAVDAQNIRSIYFEKEAFSVKRRNPFWDLKAFLQKSSRIAVRFYRFDLAFLIGFCCTNRLILRIAWRRRCSFSTRAIRI